MVGVRALRRRLVGGDEQPRDAFEAFARKARAEYFDPAIAMIGCAPLLPVAMCLSEHFADAKALAVASAFSAGLVSIGLLIIRRGWPHRDDLLWLQQHAFRGE